ncbi:11441_t:CDS:2, partial [Acaulospora colombiana]
VIRIDRGVGMNQSLTMGYDSEALIKGLPVYPDDDDEILSTWEERARAWKEIDQRGAGRLMACSWAKNNTHHMGPDYC